MGTKVNKTAIGAFVLGAIALLVTGVLVLGAGKFFTTQHTYITYFSGNVKGLNVGSPVMFRGVKVGSVTEISIMVDPVKKQLTIPVIFTLEPEKFEGAKSEFQRDPKSIEKAVTEFALRTQLQSMSFVTGQLMVALDFFPDKPPVFIGLNKEYLEVPSVPTPLEELQKTLENLPLKEIVENLNITLAEIQRLVSSIDAKKTTQTLEATIRDVQILVRHVNAKVDPLVENILNTSETAAETLEEAKGTLVDGRGHMKELSASTKSTLESARAALEQSEKTLQSFSGDSRFANELNRTLRELAAATRSLRHLSDYLERHPEALIRGKAGAKGE